MITQSSECPAVVSRPIPTAHESEPPNQNDQAPEGTKPLSPARRVEVWTRYVNSRLKQFGEHWS